MTARRAREVRRSKMLRAMYCPGGRLHGPLPTMAFSFKMYYARVAAALFTLSTPLLACFERLPASRRSGVVFPVDLAGT